MPDDDLLTGIVESPPRRIRPTTSHLSELSQFAKDNNLTVGSTTGGTHNRGSLHYSGNAMDIKGSGGFDDTTVNRLSRLASERGLKLRDERVRPKGQAVWNGSHIHLEYAGGVQDDLMSGIVADDDLSSGVVGPKRTAPPQVEQVDTSLPKAFQRIKIGAGGGRIRELSKQDTERPLYDFQRGQPATSSISSDELRVMKGEQPLDRLAFQREADLQARAPQPDRQQHETDEQEAQQRQARAVNDKPEIDRLAREYRKAIRTVAESGGPTASNWMAEAVAKGTSGLTQTFAGIVRASKYNPLAVGAEDAADAINVHAQALQQAAMEEGADRNAASKLVNDIVGGFIGSAPELAAMSAGLPAPLVFGAGTGTKAYGARQPVAPAALHGAATGAAFELPVEGALAKAGTVGAATTGIDLASGSSPREAIVSGLTNAAMVGVPHLMKARADARQAETQPTEPGVSVGIQPEQHSSVGVLMEQGRERGADNIDQRQGRGTGDAEAAQRFYHKDWGEVVKLEDQSGARRARTKVAEVGDPEKIHYPRTADLSGSGNQRMVPIRETPNAESTPSDSSASLLQRGQLSPETILPQPTATTASPETLPTEGARPDTPSIPVENQSVNEAQPSREATLLPRETNAPLSREGRNEFVLPKGGTVTRPLAAEGLTSYRYRPETGMQIAIGAKDNADALNEASRSLSSGKPDISRLDVWDGEKYVLVEPSTPSVTEGAQLPESEVRKETQIAPPNPLERGTETTSQPKSSEGTGVGDMPAPSTTAAKRGKVTADRLARGDEPIPKPERKPDEKLLSDAKSANEKDPTEPIRIVDQVLNGKKGAMSDTETVQVDLHVQELKNKYDEVNKELASATDPAKIKDLAEKSDAMEREMRASEEAWAQSGTEKGRALRAQRIEIDNDFRLLTMTAKRIKAKGEKPLTTEERELIKTQHGQIEELSAKLETADTRAEQSEAERAITRIKRDVAKETRKQTRGAKKQNLDDEAATLKDLIAQAWKKQKGGSSGVQPLLGLGKFDPEGEITRLVLKLARNRVQKGTVSAQGLVDEIHGLLKDVMEVDKRQVRDMISGYGRAVQSRSALQKQIDALKSELYGLSSEEDIAIGRRSPRSEGPRQSEINKLPRQGPTLREGTGKREGPRLSEVPIQGPRLTEAPLQGPRKSDINRLPRQGPTLREGVGTKEGPQLGPKQGPRDTLPAYRKRLESQIEVLQKKIDAGDFSKAEKRGPTIYDAHTLAIQKRLETIKRDYYRANYRATRGRLGMVTDELAKAANVPKTLKSMGDVSAMFRQGGFYAITHPVEGLAKPTRDMLRSFTEAGYRNVENAIKNDSDFEASKRDGVEYTGVDKADPNLSHHEESYFGGETIDLLATGKYNPLRVVKGVKNFSERTFVSFLDSQRLHMYKTMKEGLTDPGIIRRTLGQKAVTRASNPQDFKNIAKLINIGTGRGDIPRFLGGNKAAPILNIGIFAPRLLASRVQMLNNMFNPVKMATMSAGSRNQMIADNVKFLAATAVVFKLAEAAGGTVNRDPDDADFLKIRFGSTTYDTLTGLQQPLRYIINMTRAMTGGETYPGKDVGEMSKRFARSKVAPGLPAIGVDYLAGEDFEGRPFSLKRELIGSREKLYTDSQFSPLPAQDVVEAMQKEGLVGAIKASPTVTGVGVQTYDEAPEKPTTKAEKLARKFVGDNIPKKTRTDEQIETGRKLSDLRARSRKGEDVKRELDDLEGQIKSKQAKAILGAVNKTRFQEDFNRLSAKQAAIVYSVASEPERAQVKDILERKSHSIANMTDAEQADMDRRLKALGMTPETGQQKQKPQRAQEAQKARSAQKRGYVFAN